MLHYLRQPNSKHKPEYHYFAPGGEVEMDGPNTLAKCIISGEKKQYFCKFNTSGIEAGHLVNPWSMYADELLSFANTMNQRTGKTLHEYKEVIWDVFVLYVKYLSSRSDVHYRQAERLALENA